MQLLDADLPRHPPSLPPHPTAYSLIAKTRTIIIKMETQISGVTRHTWKCKNFDTSSKRDELNSTYFIVRCEVDVCYSSS